MNWIEGKPKELIAGMLVQDNRGNVGLVGDLNVNGGVCDCCTWGRGFDAMSDIVRYAIVYER